MGMVGNRIDDRNTERERVRWNMFRNSRLKSLNEELKDGRVDAEMINIIRSINSYEDAVSLSCCSGRIGVIDIPAFGDKKNAVFKGKWHREVNVEEVISALKVCSREGWFKVEPPILHVAVSTPERANSLIKAGLNAGFKRSAIISVSDWKIVVEITGTEVIETLLSIEEKILVPYEYIDILVDHANRKLRKSRKKLKRLEKELLIR